MIPLGNRHLEPRTLKEHNESVMLANGILTGKEFRALKRKKSRQRKVKLHFSN